MSDCNGNSKTSAIYTKVVSIIISNDKADESGDVDGNTVSTVNDQVEPREKYSDITTAANPTFEDVQVLIGESGKWQLQIVILATFSGFCISLHTLIYGFIGVIPTYWCQVPNGHVNYSREQLQGKLASNIKHSDIQCLKHPYIWNNSTRTSSISIEANSTVHCTSFEYDRSEFQSTVATEWNLVCEYAEWASYIQVSYMLGTLVGSPLFGAVSDKIGRKSTLLVVNLIAVLSSLLIIISNNFGTFLVLRFILGMASPGLYNCCYVLALEIVSNRWRSTVGSLFNIPFSLGYIVLSILAYFFRSWKILQLACSVPLVLFLGACWLLPESPRWLIGKGRVEKAEHILRAATKANGNEHKVPPNFSDILKNIYDAANKYEERKSESFCTKFANVVRFYMVIILAPRMRRIFFILCFCLITITMTYYGLGLNSSNLPTNRYSYFFINGVLEFPSFFLILILLKHVGRKPLFVCLLWTCALVLLTSVCLPEGSQVIVLLSYLGKLFIGAAYTLSYLYAFEMLPTSVCNFVLSVLCMMGYLGSAIAPLIIDGRYSVTCTYLIFGCLTATAGFLSLILPETRNRPLPETVDDLRNERTSKNEK